MTAAAWKRKIQEQIKAVGTYRPAFASVIDALSKILEQRDRIYEQFLSEGGEFVTKSESYSGQSTKITKNPLLDSWMNLNSLALSYWRDLGLTPSGLKKIDEAAMKPKKRAALDEVLRDLA